MPKSRSDHGVWSAPLILALVVATALSGLPATAAAETQEAGEPRHRGGDPQDLVAFLGLWQGIDRLDGSSVQVSLSDIDGDGLVELTQSEGFFTVCAENGPGSSQGRGVVIGAGRVQRRGELVLESTLTCIDDSGGATSAGPPASQTYTLHSHDRVLLLPAFETAPAIVLHRIAP